MTWCRHRSPFSSVITSGLDIGEGRRVSVSSSVLVGISHSSVGSSSGVSDIILVQWKSTTNFSISLDFLFLSFAWVKRELAIARKKPSSSSESVSISSSSPCLTKISRCRQKVFHQGLRIKFQVQTKGNKRI